MKKCLLEECDNLTSNPKYCSLSCGAKNQQRNTVRVVQVKECAREECNETFRRVKGRYENIYCSRSCAAKVNNQNRGEQRKCLYCEKIIGRVTQKLYCSPECGTQYRKQQKIMSWLDGSWSGTTESGLSATIRLYLIEQAGFKCASPTCAVPGGFSEINPVTGKCPLEIDHLDGNCYNNTRENLMVVCPNCHALTPTYRALNKGSGRSYRRK